MPFDVLAPALFPLNRLNMRTASLFLLLVFASVSTLGQNGTQDYSTLVLEEGKALYMSEMASWYGTDLFLEKYTAHDNIGGYFSYMDDNTPTCIFFSKGDAAVVIGTMRFDSTYALTAASADLQERPFTTTERDLFTIRQKAFKAISNDSMFRVYPNSSLNLIPLISGDSRKVFVLTGPQQSGVIIFGNDYLLTFDLKSNIISQRALHKNILPTYYEKKGNSDEGETGGMHTHLPGTDEFITSTDICTLMLFERFTNWKTYTVVSKNYFSLWNCETNNLAIITKKAMDRIYKDVKKRKNKPGKPDGE